MDRITLPILLNVVDEHKEKNKDLTLVLTMDWQHEKTTKNNLCTTPTPHHQPAKRNQSKGRKGL